MESISQYKIKVNGFSAELEEPLDRSLRTLITIEADIYDVGTPDNGDGTFNKVYKSKLVGSTIVKQGDKKPILAKSKRSLSQRLRLTILEEDTEEAYDVWMNKLINNWEDVREFLKDK